MANTPRAIADDLVVSLAYTLHDGEGELLDNADADSPLEYIQGYGHILAGLEDELYGMAVGDEKDVVIAPDNAYGEYDAEANQLVPLDMFPQDMDLEAGVQLELHDEDSDEPVDAWVAEIYDDSVLIDFNHPLAGETLYFHVKVLGIRDATDEELDHGHVHGSGHEHS